jgi:hypothetical protein
MHDSPTSGSSVSSDKPSSPNEGHSVLRLSLTALALIAGGLFLMMQDDSQASQTAVPTHQSR